MIATPRTAGFALSLLSTIALAPLSKADSFTAILVYKGGEEQTYSATELTETNIRFPIYLPDAKPYTFEASWYLEKDQKQVSVRIADPSNIIPSDSGSNVTSSSAHPYPIFSANYSYTSGKRQLAYTSPNYSIWFQIDDEKKNSVSERAKQPILAIEGPAVKHHPNGAKDISFPIKPYGEILAEKAKVVLHIYEKNEKGELVLTNERPTPSKWTTGPVDWKDGATEKFLIEYPGPSDPSKTFAGAIVAIYYDNELQSVRSIAEPNITLPDISFPTSLSASR